MRKLTIAQMQALAKAKKGVCLSTVYVKTLTKLRWRCAEGHEWESTPGNVKRGRWCQVCAGHAPLTIKHMQALAKKRGGKCLSKTYVNAHTKLRWQCAEGHEWESTPSNMKQRVKRGHWCTKCPSVSRLTPRTRVTHPFPR